MQIDARVHFYAIVVPAIEAYKQAETELMRAIVDKHDEDAQTKARYSALRQGGAAAIFLHHFSDIVARRPPENLPNFEGNVASVRKWLSELSSQEHGTNNVALLGDIADALKHAVLTYRLPREVEEAGQVLAVARRYGTGRYGEGKFSGVDEVWVLSRSGKRPLRSILSSVRAVWERALAI
jgi:hypothetical protein